MRGADLRVSMDWQGFDLWGERIFVLPEELAGVVDGGER